VCLVRSGSRYGTVAVSCEHCNEHSGSVKYGIFLDHLSDYRFVVTVSCVCVWLKVGVDTTPEMPCILRIVLYIHQMKDRVRNTLGNHNKPLSRTLKEYTSMPLEGLEPAIPVLERYETVLVSAAMDW
jgi:hypothetical protein